MTIKELYEWAKENNCENYDILTDDKGIINEEDVRINRTIATVTI